MAPLVTLNQKTDTPWPFATDLAWQHWRVLSKALPSPTSEVLEKQNTRGCLLFAGGICLRFLIKGINWKQEDPITIVYSCSLVNLRFGRCECCGITRAPTHTHKRTGALLWEPPSGWKQKDNHYAGSRNFETNPHCSVSFLPAWHVWLV